MAPRLRSPILLVLALAASLAGPRLARSQGEGTHSPGTLRVFLDCQTGGCDFQFFRREIDWVDWVRNRDAAEVHVLVTSRRTGGGGSRYELAFIGRQGYAGKRDTLVVDTQAATTPDERRARLVRRLRAGFVPFVAASPAADRLRISLAPGGVTDGQSAGGGTGEAQRDPWHAWVLSTGAFGSVRGESRSSAVEGTANLSANRTTEAWKIRLELEGEYLKRTFQLEEGRRVSNVLRNYGAEGLVVKSVGPNWSTGIRTSAASATYQNEDLLVRVAPAVEYNIFPYSESSRRELTVLYSVGASYVDYELETIFGKTEDRLLDHALDVSLDLRQPWGSAGVDVRASQYLGWSPAALPSEASAGGSKYRVSLDGNLQFRVAGGLFLELNANYSILRNQISLPAEAASDEEILLRIRQLQTGYRYSGAAGVRYTFGSIYNNVVNTRF